MRIALASDHAGFRYKERLRQLLAERGPRGRRLRHPLRGAGRLPAASSGPAAAAVAAGECERGIVLGGSGNGEAMAANRVRGVRCALCWSRESGALARAPQRRQRDLPRRAAAARGSWWRIVETWLDDALRGRPPRAPHRAARRPERRLRHRRPGRLTRAAAPWRVRSAPPAAPARPRRPARRGEQRRRRGERPGSSGSTPKSRPRSRRESGIHSATPSRPPAAEDAQRRARHQAQAGAAASPPLPCARRARAPPATTAWLSSPKSPTMATVSPSTANSEATSECMRCGVTSRRRASSPLVSSTSARSGCTRCSAARTWAPTSFPRQRRAEQQAHAAVRPLGDGEVDGARRRRGRRPGAHVGDHADHLPGVLRAARGDQAPPRPPPRRCPTAAAPASRRSPPRRAASAWSRSSIGPPASTARRGSRSSRARRGRRRPAGAARAVRPPPPPPGGASRRAAPGAPGSALARPPVRETSSRQAVVEAHRRAAVEVPRRVEGGDVEVAHRVAGVVRAGALQRAREQAAAEAERQGQRDLDGDQRAAGAEAAGLGRGAAGRQGAAAAAGEHRGHRGEAGDQRAGGGGRRGEGENAGVEPHQPAPVRPAGEPAGVGEGEASSRAPMASAIGSPSSPPATQTAPPSAITRTAVRHRDSPSAARIRHSRLPRRGARQQQVGRRWRRRAAGRAGRRRRACAPSRAADRVPSRVVAVGADDGDLARPPTRAAPRRRRRAPPARGRRSRSRVHRPRGAQQLEPAALGVAAAATCRSARRRGQREIDGPGVPWPWKPSGAMPTTVAGGR